MKAGLVVFFFLSCAFNRLFPQEITGEEQRLWNRAEEECQILDASDLILRDTIVETYLNRIVAQLGEGHEITYSVKVLKNPYLNAFAMPNGRIYLHTGILAEMGNEAQLATLLGHELTHAKNKHALKSIRSIKSKSAFMATLSVGTAGFGLAGLAVDLLGTLGTMASISGYSQSLESEADTCGLRLVVEQGYDPQESPMLFRHLLDELEEEKIKEPFFYSTHPKLKDRIKNYESLLAKKYSSHKGNIHQQTYLSAIRLVLIENSRMNIQMGRFARANRSLYKHLKVDTLSAEVYFLLGESVRQQYGIDSLSSIERNYTKALEIDSNHAETLKNWGLLKMKAGEKESAVPYFERYLSLCVDCPDRKYIEVYLTQLTKDKTE
jgi:predicted Zn-dependent protease